MNYQPQLRLGFPVDPIPSPRAQVRHLMLATALVIDGPVDISPGQLDERLENCLYMPQASVLIVGTACSRPLLLREANDISVAAGLDVVVVRATETPANATFDLRLIGMAKMACCYRMWMPRPNEAGWLIPTAGEGLFVRLAPTGLEAFEQAPFVDEAERHVGLLRGSEFLSVAVQGWF